MTPPNVISFIELALMRLGEEMMNGLDYDSRTEKAKQVINHWNNVGEIADETREKLLQCWDELLIDVRVRDRELSIRRSEGNTDTDDVHMDTKACYVDFIQCVGDCLDPILVA